MSSRFDSTIAKLESEINQIKGNINRKIEEVAKLGSDVTKAKKEIDKLTADMFVVLQKQTKAHDEIDKLTAEQSKKQSELTAAMKGRDEEHKKAEEEARKHNAASDSSFKQGQNSR